MARHRRQYLFALVDSGGTVPPELAVASRLVHRGQAVTVLGSPLMEPEVHATGADFRSWTRAPYRRSTRPEDDLTRDWGAGPRYSSSPATSTRSWPVRRPRSLPTSTTPSGRTDRTPSFHQ